MAASDWVAVLAIGERGLVVSQPKTKEEKPYRQACGGRFYAPPHANDGETEGCRRKRP